MIDTMMDTLPCMDCLELMETIPDGAVSMILTDPPYGISYQNQFTQHPHPVLEGDTGIDYVRFARESYRILRNHAHAYFFTRFDCYPYHYACLEQAGFRVKNCLIVEKATVGGVGDLYGSFANNAEWVIFCQKGRRVFNRTTLMQNKYSRSYDPKRKPYEKYKTRFNACWFGSEYPKATYHSLWQKHSGICHPTVKNVEFLSWLIQLSSHPGEIIFDGFMGTGSTALAAIQNNRHYIGAEIDEGYCALARKRIEEVKNNE